MSFTQLNKDELKELSEFYAVEVTAADDKKGPTKKEYLAALAEDDITEDDHRRFLQAKQAGQDKSPEVKRLEAEAEAALAKNTEDKTTEDKAAEDDEDALGEAEEAEDDEPQVKEDEVLVKYERKNGTWQAAGYTFTKAHPFASVPVSVAEFLIQKQKGFRLALPSEVTDYYG